MTILLLFVKSRTEKKSQDICVEISANRGGLHEGIGKVKDIVLTPKGGKKNLPIFSKKFLLLFTVDLNKR